MKTIDKLYIITLTNNDVIAGVKMDTIDELTFIRYPALLSSSSSCGPLETGMFLLSGNPKEVIIYNRAIIHYYTTTSEALLERYMAARLEDYLPF